MEENEKNQQIRRINEKRFLELFEKDSGIILIPKERAKEYGLVRTTVDCDCLFCDNNSVLVAVCEREVTEIRCCQNLTCVARAIWRASAYGKFGYEFPLLKNKEEIESGDSGILIIGDKQDQGLIATLFRELQAEDVRGANAFPIIDLSDIIGGLPMISLPLIIKGKETTKARPNNNFDQQKISKPTINHRPRPQIQAKRGQR